MYSFEDWFEYNQEELKKLYFELINISLKYNIKLINNQKSINEFIDLIYGESSKHLILY